MFSMGTSQQETFPPSLVALWTLCATLSCRLRRLSRLFIPASLSAACVDAIENARTQVLPFPSETILKAIQDTKASLNAADLAQLEDRIKPLEDIVNEYLEGHKQHERKVVASLIEKYLIVEETFCKNDATQ
ncbi:hypothetical protein HDU79_009095 [Rhizoclosmatium sp. JEL0117]|nr:hypothetical protein HDU79_009095 [Rhizoclosmatium sp. JEL0117]